MSSNTPKSGQRMSEDCGPDGIKRSKFPDGESPNSCEAFDGKAPVVPLNSDGHLKDSAGQR